jgi:hypothetical protein
MPGIGLGFVAGCMRATAGDRTARDSVWVEQWLEALEPYVGTGVALALYGGFGWTVEGHWMIVEDFELEPCTTAGRPSTWSEAKQLFR